eukprot:m.362790 g.362790  ORF g.362790 m.362790 type:complete len:346 (-) comp19962_c0_seq11:116-1153(-)
MMATDSSSAEAALMPGSTCGDAACDPALRNSSATGGWRGAGRLTLHTCPGTLTEQILSELAAMGITEVTGLLTADQAKLVAATSLDPQGLRRVRAAALRTRGRVVCARDLLASKARHNIILKTGVSSLDVLLHGGWRSGEWCELFGLSNSGKTQICVTSMLSVAACNRAKVVFINTHGPATMHRLHQMAAMKGQDRVTVFSRIDTFVAFNVFQLFSQLLAIRQRLATQPPGTTRLVVIDSLAAILSPIVGAKTHGHALLQRVSRTLKALADDFSLAILTTNFSVNPVTPRPALGVAWSSGPNVRLAVRYPQDASSSTERVAEIAKSSLSPVHLCVTFAIEASGAT